MTAENHTTNGLTRDIFTEQISVFSSPKGVADTEARHYVRTVGQFLDAGRLYASQVQHVRDVRAKAFDAYNRGDVRGYDLAMDEYKREKGRQPFAILQGVCPERKNDGFLSYSRVLCLDIDAPKPTESTPLNSWVNDWEQVKQQISLLPFVSYCALSVGGAGLFVLIPIADPARYGDYFDTLSDLFAKYLRLTVDKQTRNIARLRFMTYDPSPYMNRNAVEWDKVLPRQQERENRGASHRHAAQNGGGDVTLNDEQKGRVRRCVDWCKSHGTLIADAHDDWMRLAGFFAHNWDDAEGRDLFHDLAAISPKYRAAENDRKLLSMGRQHPHPVTLHGFYRLCRNYGVPVPDGWDLMGGWNHRGVVFPTVTPSKRGTGEEQARNTQISRINTPVSASNVVTGIVTPPPTMSAAEGEELKRHQSDIAQGLAIVERMRRDVVGFDALMDDFSLDFAGLDDWCMTPAQVFAVSQNYSNFVTQ